MSRSAIAPATATATSLHLAGLTTLVAIVTGALLALCAMQYAQTADAGDAQMQLSHGVEARTDVRGNAPLEASPMATHSADSLAPPHATTISGIVSAATDTHVRQTLMAGALVTVLLTWSVALLANRRKRARAVARRMTAELERLSSVAEHTSDSVALIDSSHRITWVNRGFERLTGNVADDAAGRSFCDLMLVEGADLARVAEIRDALRAERRYTGEIRRRSKEGRAYWARLTLQALRDDAGELTGFIAVETDITNARDTTDALCLARQRMDAIFAGHDAGTYAWNLSTGTTLVNGKAAAMLGYRIEELPPLHIADWFSLIHEEDQARWSDLTQAHLRGETDLFECEVRMQHRKGHWVRLLSRCKVSARKKEGQAEAVTGAFVDLGRGARDEADV